MVNMCVFSFDMSVFTFRRFCRFVAEHVSFVGVLSGVVDSGFKDLVTFFFIL